MNLVVIHRNTDLSAGRSDDLLRFAVSSEPLAAVTLDGLRRGLSWSRSSVHTLQRLRKRTSRGTILAVPEEWSVKPRSAPSVDVVQYANAIPVSLEFASDMGRNDWFVVSNGRLATQVKVGLLAGVLTGVQADVVAVSVDPELLETNEKVRLTAQGRLAGFRRLYRDSAEFAPLPPDWPDRLLFRTDVLGRVFDEGVLPESFAVLLDKCRSKALTLRAVRVAGVVLDLETEGGLLSFCAANIPACAIGPYKPDGRTDCNVAAERAHPAPRNPRFAGKVLLGGNVRIGSDVVIVGPAVVGDNAQIEQGAVISSSIIGPNVHVPAGQLVQNRVVREPQFDGKCSTTCESGASWQVTGTDAYSWHRGIADGSFRRWRGFSYARCFKRIADVIAAVIVLALFAPIMPFVALAIKLTSPGPVFYRDKRQGFHGRVFNCLKFRTMRTGADRMQEKLRVASQVDGPQFKIRNDPRISTVGRFLRDTYIDEIPQFLNVLLGQMSVVGPRPSPESENTLCPSWRDARLSVRPGITGLWQVCRTRKPGRDFQEWIHYDTKYVRELALRMDLWICWQTVRHVVGSFASQF